MQVISQQKTESRSRLKSAHA